MMPCCSCNIADRMLPVLPRCMATLSRCIRPMAWFEMSLEHATCAVCMATQVSGRFVIQPQVPPVVKKKLNLFMSAHLTALFWRTTVISPTRRACVLRWRTAIVVISIPILILKYCSTFWPMNFKKKLIVRH